MNIRNTKTNTVGILLETYNRTSDGQKMHIVLAGYGKIHWAAKNCEEA